jgi:hypothetical protein
VKSRAKKRSLAAMTSTSRRGTGRGGGAWGSANKMIAGIIAEGRELTRMGKTIVANAMKLHALTAKAQRNATTTRRRGPARARRTTGGTTTTPQRRAA